MPLTSRYTVAWFAAATFAVGLTACGGGPSYGPAPVATAEPTTSATSTAPATAAPTASASAAAHSPLPEPTVGNGGVSGSAPAATPAMIVTASPSPTTTATLTPQGTPLPAGEKIYVVNHGVPLGNVSASNAQTASLTVYPVAATGAATPLATLTGPSTGLDQAQFVAVDQFGTVYVTNQGTSLAGTLTAYAGGLLNGNVAPSATVTGLYQPEGVCVDDAHNYVFVVTYYTVNVYRTYANGSIVLDHVIEGAQPDSQEFAANEPQLFGAYGCSVNDGNVYIAAGNQWLGFPTTASGNVAPTYNYAGPAALLFSSLGIAADSSGDVFVTNLDSNAVTEFAMPSTTATADPTSTAAAATSDTPPTATITGTSFSEPFGSAIDTGGQYYLTNIGSNSVDVFSSTTVLLTGVPTATISGTGTGLNRPYGVYAR